MNVTKTSTNFWIFIAVIVMLIASTTSRTASANPTAPQSNETALKQPSYPLDYCIVTGEKLGSMGDPVVRIYNDREVQFCGESCVKLFEKNKTKWLKKLDAAMIESQEDFYPLETCVVTGEKLGSMGNPVDFIYHNRLIRLCCNGCLSAFKSEPDKYLQLLDEAAASKNERSDEPPAPRTDP